MGYIIDLLIIYINKLLLCIKYIARHKLKPKQRQIRRVGNWNNIAIA